MQEGSDLAHQREVLGFLYGRCSMSRSAMGAWFEDDDFIRAMWRVVCSDTVITDKVILEVAEPILKEHFENRKLHEGFKFQNARKGLNQLRRAIESK